MTYNRLISKDHLERHHSIAAILVENMRQVAVVSLGRQTRCSGSNQNRQNQSKCNSMRHRIFLQLFFSLSKLLVFEVQFKIYKHIKINTIIIYSIRALFLKLTTDRDHTTDSTATEFILTMILKETRTRRLAD